MSTCAAPDCEQPQARQSRCLEHIRAYMREYMRRRDGYYGKPRCQELDCHAAPVLVGACRKHAGLVSYQHSCQRCGTYFLTRNRRRLFCSTPCAKRAGALRRGVAVDRPRCESGCGTALRREGMCRNHAPVPIVYRSCLQCGSLYVVPASNTLRKFCAPVCAQRRANVDSRHRLRSAERSGDRIYPRQVYERDGWRCGLCHRPIHAHLVSPHPGSPTLDHVIPLSRGGEHVWTNVQAAHRRCNTRKNRYVWGESEQLRLVG